MYLNPDSLIWEVIPRDFDVSFTQASLPVNYGTSSSPDFLGGHNILLDRLLKVPRFRQWYVNKLDEILRNDFTPGILGPRIDLYHARVREDAMRDVFKRTREQNAAFLASPQELKNFVSQRRTFLFQQIATYSPRIEQPVMLNEVLVSGTGGDDDDREEQGGWIELYNPATAEYKLKDHYLTNNPVNRRMWKFPNSAKVAPRSRLLVWLDSETDEDDKKSVQTNFRLNGTGHAVALYGPDSAGNPLLDVIAFGPQTGSISFGRRADGSALWKVQTVPTPNGANRSQ
jgi:hypothetical protein